jgi:hypothetical protein
VQFVSVLNAEPYCLTDVFGSVCIQVFQIQCRPVLLASSAFNYIVFLQWQCLAQIHFYIFFPSTYTSSEWSPSIGLPNQKFLRISHLPVITTCLACLIFLDFIIIIISGEEYKQWSPSLWSFLQPSVSSSLLGSNILLLSLFSIACILYSFLNVRDSVAYSFRATGNTTFLYFLIFMLIYNRRENRSLWTAL